MHYLDINGSRIAYHESGSGTPVLLLHSSSATHAMWAQLISELEVDHLVVAPDFSGYGESVRFPVTKHIGTLPDTELTLAILDALPEPAHVIAHSYGAAIALEAARKQSDKIRSLTLIEPVSFHLLKNSEYQTAWHEAKIFVDAIVKHSEQGDFKAACKTYSRYWLGRLAWLKTKSHVKKHIISTMYKVAAECTSVINCNSDTKDLYSLNLPITLIRGSKTQQTVNCIHKVLLSCLPRSKEIIIREAGHLSPMSHRLLVNSIITNTLGAQPS